MPIRLHVCVYKTAEPANWHSE